MSFVSRASLVASSFVITALVLAGRPAGADESFTLGHLGVHFPTGAKSPPTSISLRGSHQSSDATPPSGFDLIDADGLVFSFDFTDAYWTAACTQRNPTAHVKCTNAARTLRWDSASVPNGTGAKPFRMRARLIYAGPDRPIVLPIASVVVRRASLANLASTPIGCSLTSRGALKCF